ncbi:MAG: tripartite tricarboxylate transporter substrate binding protein [Betaproteobacteria bacterium]|nr:tripartite tricarboxylate transporter substrate binding protein [Betaproteobacteria bacterium]
MNLLSRLAAMAAALVALLPVDAEAQPAWPTRAVKLVVPYPPGGGTDITARAMANRLSGFLGQPVVVENRPGATGMIGADSVAKAKNDGYTLLFGAASEMAINASLFRKMAYNPRSDFEPVSLVASFPLVFVAPATYTGNLASMIDTAKASPGGISYGSIGAGSPQHLAGELLVSMAAVKFTHVPYKGSGPLVQDAIAGHVSMAISSVPPAVPLVKAGKLRALAVTSAKRSAAMPEVPTMAELGYAGYEFNTWVALAAPAGTPKAIVERLHDAVVKTLALPDVQAVLRDQGAEPIGSTPERLRAFVGDEIAKSDRIVARADIKLD